jgi:hypothetical protein
MATYYELVIKGDDKDLVPFVAGFAEGGGAKGIFVASESGFQMKSLRERIKYHGETHHVICEARFREKLRKAIEAAAGRFHLEVQEEVEIRRACFRFGFNTPSRDVANQIKKILGSLPEGVTTTDYAPKEIVHPDAKGAEVYSPAHEYEFRGKGQVEGDVGGVVAVRMALAEIDFAKVEEI